MNSSIYSQIPTPFLFNFLCPTPPTTASNKQQYMLSHYCSSFMAAFLFFLVFVLLMSSSSTTAQGPPFPGFYPSSSVQSNGFSQYFRNLWGPQHQRLDDQGSVTIWLDNTSGQRVKKTTTM